jgi:hypothetical protein
MRPVWALSGHTTIPAVDGLVAPIVLDGAQAKMTKLIPMAVEIRLMILPPFGME